MDWWKYEVKTGNFRFFAITNRFYKFLAKIFQNINEKNLAIIIVKFRENKLYKYKLKNEKNDSVK